MEEFSFRILEPSIRNMLVEQNELLQTIIYGDENFGPIRFTGFQTLPWRNE